MRLELLSKLQCPECDGGLSAENIQTDTDDLMEGQLRCRSCETIYPVQQGIPNLLPRDLR